MSTPKQAHTEPRLQPGHRNYVDYNSCVLSDGAHFSPLPHPPVPQFEGVSDGYATPAITSLPFGYPPPSIDCPPHIRFGRTGICHHIGEHMRQYNGEKASCSECRRSGGDLVDEVAPFAPPVDILFNDQAVTVHVWIPGVKKRDVNMKWVGESNALCIKGLAQRSGNENLEYKLVCAESRTGKFKRCISLAPEIDVDQSIDEDNIKSALENGVLIVTLPKIERDWTNLWGIKIEP